MDDPVSAADANRRFFRLMRGARDGHSYVVTSHGRPVARLVAPSAGDDCLKTSARAALIERLRKQPLAKARRWTRADLYDSAGA